MFAEIGAAQLDVELIVVGDDLVEVPANLSLPDGTTISAFVTMEAGQTVDKTFTVPRVTQGGVGIVQIEDGKIADFGKLDIAKELQDHGRSSARSRTSGR